MTETYLSPRFAKSLSNSSMPFTIFTVIESFTEIWSPRISSFQLTESLNCVISALPDLCPLTRSYLRRSRAHLFIWPQSWYRNSPTTIQLICGLSVWLFTSCSSALPLSTRTQFTLWFTWLWRTQSNFPRIWPPNLSLSSRVSLIRHQVSVYHGLNYFSIHLLERLIRRKRTVKQDRSSIISGRPLFIIVVEGSKWQKFLKLKRHQVILLLVLIRTLQRRLRNLSHLASQLMTSISPHLISMLTRWPLMIKKLSRQGYQMKLGRDSRSSQMMRSALANWGMTPLCLTG
jgi:hypothetical protein